MKLHDLISESCPKCGAMTTLMAQEYMHTNGHYFERRAYDCKYEVAFNPSSMQSEDQKPCTNSLDYKIFIQKRKLAVERLVKFMSNLDVDNEYKRQLAGDFGWRQQ